MATSQRRAFPRSALTLALAIEACWLASVALVPLAAVHQDWLVGASEVPKVFLQRTFALLLIVLVVAEWARTGAGFPLMRGWLTIRSRPILLSALPVLVATSVSAMVSPMPVVSLLGPDVGWDSFGVASLLSYLVVFAVIATRLRSGAQVRRLLWAVTVPAVLIGWYGMGQHFGIDLLRVDASPSSRVPLTFGNPIFGAAYLILTIPLTLALWQGWRQRYSLMSHAAIGGALISLQAAAIAFTLSRGSMISLAVALVVFLAMAAWSMGREVVKAPAVSIVVAIGFAFVMSYVPVPGDVDTSGQFDERLLSVGSAFTSAGGGLTGRFTIWDVSLDVYADVPWVDTGRFDDMPELSWAPLHQVVGYGPDMFGYAFPLAGDTRMASRPNHAHNAIVHTAVEVGALGLIAYAVLLVAVAAAGLRLVRSARAGSMPTWVGFVVAGLLASLVGRFVEQMAGKPQVADLALTWVLIGTVAAVLGWTAEQWEAEPALVSERGKSGRRLLRGQRQVQVVGGRRGPQVAIAVVVGLVATVAWWQVVVGPLSVSSLVARAEVASESGRPVRAGELLESAVESYPAAAVPRLLLGRGLLLGSRAASTQDLRIAGLQEALGVVEGAFDRNPMDYRAWVTAGKITQEMAALDAARFGELAIATAEKTAALLPGYRDPREQLALTLLVAGEYDRAIEVAAGARGLAATTDPDGVYLDYITAKSLIRSGRVDEAVPLIAQIVGSGYVDAAVLVQDLQASE
ncbi:MAG: O-antigen ligase family protein [Chloroflexi bacterium]|nr:O-antigen ligase family protein [Chloroflexota bacterium]